MMPYKKLQPGTGVATHPVAVSATGLNNFFFLTFSQLQFCISKNAKKKKKEKGTPLNT